MKIRLTQMPDWILRILKTMDHRSKFLGMPFSGVSGNKTYWLLFVVLLATATIGIRQSYTQVSNPTTQPLLHSGDITYLGYFNVPSPGGSGIDSFDYGGMALAMGADGNSLYVGGHVYNHSIGRVAIPSGFGGTATLIQSPVNVPGGPGGELAQTNGALVWNNRLIVQDGSHYDTNGSAPTHTVGNLNISGFSPFSSHGDLTYAAFGNGYMGIIPPEWRTLLGGPCFSGNSTMSIVSMNSVGPSFYVFSPDDVNITTPIPSIPLMYFPLSNPLADTNVANDLISRADQYNAGLVFPSGTRSVLFIYRHGYGPHTYKIDDGCGGAQGEGAAPYRRQVTAFDANDLLAVKNGTKQPWDVRPYAWWVLPGPVDTCSQFAYSGLAYDPATRRIYIAFAYGSQPRIQVFQIAGGTTSTPPNPPTGFRIVTP